MEPLEEDRDDHGRRRAWTPAAPPKPEDAVYTLDELRLTERELSCLRILLLDDMHRAERDDKQDAPWPRVIREVYDKITAEWLRVTSPSARRDI